MSRSVSNEVGDFFALDIGSSAIRVVQLKGRGANRSLFSYGSAPIDLKLSSSDAEADQAKVADLVTGLVAKVGISTTNVVLGLPSNKTFVSVVDLPKADSQELTASIKYQAEQYIPLPLDDVKLDWCLLGASPADANKSEVLLASVSKKFSEARMDMMESRGFNVVGLEPDSIALARALTPLGAKSVTPNSPALIIVDMGLRATDIVVSLPDAPRLVRSIPTGADSFIKAAVQNLNVDENQARQFVFKFGMDQTKLEGQVYTSVEATADIIASEIQKSIQFYVNRYTGSQIGGILVSGAVVTIPGFANYISTKNDNIGVQIGNCWQNTAYANNIHEKLMSVNDQFAVAVGLAEHGI